MVSAIGTGKTMMLLLKVWDYCQKYPNSLALLVRKEYTDLRDSTIKDFATYFNANVDHNKEYKFKNGSVIMFRHGAELNVLKNINLSIAGIEQAEEFDTDEIFTFIRDRLRRQNAPYRQCCVIANANGHNWVWKLWVNNPSSNEFDVSQATTFDNADVLPADFIADCRQQEFDAPNHYRRYILNSHEDLETDDNLFTFDRLREAIELNFNSYGLSKSILAVDVARYGNAETVFTNIATRGVLRWEQTFLERWKKNNLMEIVGKVADLKRELNPDVIVIDDDGMGGGVTDRLIELKIEVVAFRGGAKPAEAKELVYGNKRTEAAFALKDLVDRNYFKLLDNSEVVDQLMTLRFEYRSDKLKTLVSKEKMRKDGIKSPDIADALLMAASQCKSIFLAASMNSRLPSYAVTDEPATGGRLPAMAIT